MSNSMVALIRFFHDLPSELYPLTTLSIFGSFEDDVTVEVILESSSFAHSSSVGKVNVLWRRRKKEKLMQRELSKTLNLYPASTTSLSLVPLLHKNEAII